MPWTAEIIDEGETMQTASGESPEAAVQALIVECLSAPEFVLDAAFLQDMTDLMTKIEEIPESLEEIANEKEYTARCGDFSQPWSVRVYETADIVVVPPCTVDPETTAYAPSAPQQHDKHAVKAIANVLLRDLFDGDDDYSFECGDAARSLLDSFTITPKHNLQTPIE